VQGERASLERNVIRNYLALLAYNGVTVGTPQAQRDARLRAWFALTERHAAQLHELDLAEYLQEKHNDLERVASRSPYTQKPGLGDTLGGLPPVAGGP
jgi:4-diphosphocytidyl-2C-methyl-D-erythritol kinase